MGQHARRGACIMTDRLVLNGYAIEKTLDSAEFTEEE
jgi:hypothetical protein